MSCIEMSSIETRVSKSRLSKLQYRNVEYRNSSIEMLSIKTRVSKSGVSKNRISKLEYRNVEYRNSSIEKSSIKKSKFENRESIKSAMLHTSLMSFFKESQQIYFKMRLFFSLFFSQLCKADCKHWFYAISLCINQCNDHSRRD